MIENSQRLRQKAQLKQSFDKDRKSLHLTQDWEQKYKKHKPDDLLQLSHIQQQRSERTNYIHPSKRASKQESVPELVIDLHEEAAVHNKNKNSQPPPLMSYLNKFISKQSSVSKKNSSAHLRDDSSNHSEKGYFPHTMELSGRKTPVDFKNTTLNNSNHMIPHNKPSSNKSKQVLLIREDYRTLERQNEALKDDNLYLRKRLQRLEKLEKQFDFLNEDNQYLKKQIQMREEEIIKRDNRMEVLLQDYKEMADKLKCMYEELIREKKKTSEIKEFISGLDNRDHYYPEALRVRDSIYKHNFQKYQKEGKADYFNSVREDNRRKQTTYPSHHS